MGENDRYFAYVLDRSYSREPFSPLSPFDLPKKNDLVV